MKITITKTKKTQTNKLKQTYTQRKLKEKEKKTENNLKLVIHQVVDLPLNCGSQRLISILYSDLAALVRLSLTASVGTPTHRGCSLPAHHLLLSFTHSKLLILCFLVKSFSSSC